MDVWFSADFRMPAVVIGDRRGTPALWWILPSEEVL